MFEGTAYLLGDNQPVHGWTRQVWKEKKVDQRPHSFNSSPRTRLRPSCLAR